MTTASAHLPALRLCDVVGAGRLCSCVVFWTLWLLGAAEDAAVKLAEVLLLSVMLRNLHAVLLDLDELKCK